jgi:hypothetical protein
VGIDHQEPHFRCQFTFVVDGKPFHGAFELVTDGRKVTHTERERLTVSTLLWDGDSLVSTDRSEGTIRFRYELLDAGHRLRVTEQKVHMVMKRRTRAVRRQMNFIELACAAVSSSLTSMVSVSPVVLFLMI